MYDQLVTTVGIGSRNNSQTAFALGQGLLLIALTIAIAMVLGGCNSQQRPPPQFAAANESLDAIAPRQCVTESSQPVECFADSECCAGFVCGKDPQLSQRQTFCIFGG